MTFQFLQRFRSKDKERENGKGKARPKDQPDEDPSQSDPRTVLAQVGIYHETCKQNGNCRDFRSMPLPPPRRPLTPPDYELAAIRGRSNTLTAINTSTTNFLDLTKSTTLPRTRVYSSRAYPRKSANESTSSCLVTGRSTSNTTLAMRRATVKEISDRQTNGAGGIGFAMMRSIQTRETCAV